MSGQTSKPSAPQLNALTGIRGIAAWMVVFYHIRLSLTLIIPESSIAILAKGYLAVDLFFMLSGFVMWLNYGTRFAGKGLRETPKFLWKRFARIWPLHVLVLSAMVVFALVLVATGRPALDYPLWELPMHVVLAQNWGFTNDLSWNHPAWSISTEFAAYLIFPLLACAVSWRRIGSYSLIAILITAVLALHLYFSTSGYSTLGDDIATTGLLRCLIEFSIGIILANLWQHHGQSAKIAGIWAIAGVGIIIVVVLFQLPETLAAPAITATGLMALASDRGPVSRLMSTMPLRWLGDVSYATYLIHFFAFILFKIVLVGDDLQMSWGQVVLFLTLVLAASAVLFHFFEKPSQRWLNGHAPRFVGQSRPPVAQSG